MVYCLWWDYGHYIEVLVTGCLMLILSNKELEVADLVLTKKMNLGAASFFTSPSEEEASAVLKAIDRKTRQSWSTLHYVRCDYGYRYIYGNAGVDT